MMMLAVQASGSFIGLDFTLRTVALGAAVLGVVSGTLGSWAVLRGRSLLGDAISHAALPGIAIAFLLTGQRTPLTLAIGAGASGWLGAMLILGITDRSRVPHDAALGLVLSVFFGVGMVLLTFIQRLPSGTQAGLDTFLFGQAAALLPREVIMMLILGAAAILATVVFWKEFKLLSFDPEFGRSIGLPMRRLDFFLTSLLVVAIVIGLQAVGVVLMSAILVAPAAAARQWSNRLEVIAPLAAVFGAGAGVTGALLSASLPHTPTGPTIVLCAGGIMLVSLFFAPGRGLVANAIRMRRVRRGLRDLGLLEDLFTLARKHADPLHPHRTAVLRAMTSTPETVSPGLRHLEQRGWARRTGPDSWGLTPGGWEAALTRFGPNGDQQPGRNPA
ncbi:MAG: metal ABC transporter permease [Gemmatimonadota bacterium]|jgi:manganese/zinc/iron transport system permease protein|nr:metal ABC transporter permease [Gemmatimonadota bacterium]